jgi:ABC-type transporter Mla MlaB component
MALRFTHQGEFFMIEGNINASTANQFKTHIEYLMMTGKSLKLNLDGIKSIDDNGCLALMELLKTSLIYNKKISIIGENKNKILKHFKIKEAA